MAESGLIVKNGALTMANGVYNLYTPDENGDRWLSNDNLCMIRYVKDYVYKNVSYDLNAEFTSEHFGKDRSYYRYNPETDSHEPIILGTDDIGRKIDDVIGVNTRLMLADSVNELPRHLTEAEAAKSDLRGGSRIYWRKNRNTDAFERLRESELDTELTISDNYIIYYSIAYTLCAGIDMSRWVLLKVTVTETGIVDGDILYCAFATSNETKPYDNLPWITMTAGGSGSALDENMVVEYWDKSGLEVSTETTTDPDGAKRIVTTFTNLATGSSYKETNVVREKLVFQPDIKTRYDYINLTVGKVYRFRFVSEFEQLGWIPGNTTQPINAGVYRVDKVMSYYDMVAGRIDLFVNLYEKCGVSKEVFDDDKKRLADTVIYRLVDPTDESRIFFMPQIFIEGHPDASVLKYNKVLLLIDLGIQPNSETVDKLSEVNPSHDAVKAITDISGLEDLLKQIIEKLYGLKPTEESPLLRLSTYGHVWLTDESFKQLLLHRETVKNMSNVDMNQLFSLDQSNRWYKENLALLTQLAAKDALLKQLFAAKASTSGSSNNETI